MSAPAIRMLWLRHGQSEWNARGRWQGMADSPLSALGRAQASAIAAQLSAMPTEFSAVWSSDLARARATAEAIAAAVGVPSVQVDTDLREAHAGEWEGLTHADIDRDWPGYLSAHRRPPDFELYESVVARALSAARTIVRHPSTGVGAVIVVAHSGLIRSLLRHVDGTDPRVPNLGGVWIDATPGASDVSIRVVGVFDPADSDADVFTAAPASSNADLLGEEPGAPLL